MVVARETMPTGATERMPMVKEIVNRLRSSSEVIRMASTSAGNESRTTNTNEMIALNRPRK